MGSIPLVALDVKPVQQPSFTEQLGQTVALRNAMQQAQFQRQMQPLQMQQEQIKTQMAQQQLSDSQIIQKAFADNQGDLSKTLTTAANAGASPNALMSLQQHAIEQDYKRAQSSEIDLKNQAAKNDQARGFIQSVLAAPPEQRVQAAQTAITQMKQQGLLDNVPNLQLPTDVNQLTASLKTIDTQLAGGSKAAQEAVATRNSDIKELQARTGWAKFQAEMDPNSPTYSPSAAYLASQASKGDPQALGLIHQMTTQAAQKEAAVTKAREEVALPYQAQLAQIRANVQAGTLAGIVGQGSGQIPQGATGEAAIANLPKEVQDAVRLVATGNADMKTVLTRMPAQGKMAFMSAVSAYNPQFNQSTFQVKQHVLTSATSGPLGQQLNSFNTAIEHMSTFREMADALHNGDVQLANRASQALGVQLGKSAATNFEIAKNAFSGEVGKAFAGANVSEHDREQLQQQISRASSPEQLRGAADTAQKLLEGKRHAIQGQIEQGLQGRPNIPGMGGVPATGAAPSGGGGFFGKYGGSAWQSQTPQ